MVQIFLKRTDGAVECINAPATISELRSYVAELEGVEACDLRLSTAAYDLSDNESFDLPENSTLFAHLRLLGGGKKRKKKTYTKPKKIKHKKKKVPKAVFKFYEVKADGTIERLRKDCPSETCGVGTFMAQHKDRRTCGKCGLTFKNP
mmetsp:Transcript_43794/g.171308  ORF Transcript_43794/g.171308 Transcript_43794/m.171308 type:complete len:148 (-) Transcript_43794:238-681(-)|eukprot:CAMPEP_0113968710 /NCGR_PEP_ID=MMETSP0011_2-20120614/9722_1 /TAXON_ID=101924 /ORGANISM="Rhodosorus marinus" /LENGTH=147 /DNA_ID=CAMNT_0000981905 /DNA_START=98 /DNA_END=541 /DNA_ORIENTATION=+ /assembly_acc=CAM_ASM_000156